jgi:hypothetical protein
MTRRRHSLSERRRRQNARYAAMERPELRLDSECRIAPAGPHSAPIKQMDPETRALIDAALARLVTRSCPRPPHPAPPDRVGGRLSPAGGEGTKAARHR